MNNKFEFTDRYQALGISYPNPETMCKGHCEGTGWYPVKNDEEIEPLEYAAWFDAHNAQDAHESDGGICDGWHFIKCLECDGTGKAKTDE